MTISLIPWVDPFCYAVHYHGGTFKHYCCFELSSEPWNVKGQYTQSFLLTLEIFGFVLMLIDLPQHLVYVSSWQPKKCNPAKQVGYPSILTPSPLCMFLYFPLQPQQSYVFFGLFVFVFFVYVCHTDSSTILFLLYIYIISCVF